MEPWMGAVAVLVVLLPVVLMLAFHGGDRADARGRRLRHEWRVRTPRRRAPRPPGRADR